MDPEADLSKGLNAFVMLSTKERNTKGVGYVLSSQIDLGVAFFLMRVFGCIELRVGFFHKNNQSSLAKRKAKKAVSKVVKIVILK